MRQLWITSASKRTRSSLKTIKVLLLKENRSELQLLIESPSEQNQNKHVRRPRWQNFPECLLKSSETTSTPPPQAVVLWWQRWREDSRSVCAARFSPTKRRPFRFLFTAAHLLLPSVVRLSASNEMKYSVFVFTHGIIRRTQKIERVRQNTLNDDKSCYQFHRVQQNPFNHDMFVTYFKSCSNETNKNWSFIAALPQTGSQDDKEPSAQRSEPRGGVRFCFSTLRTFGKAVMSVWSQSCCHHAAISLSRMRWW